VATLSQADAAMEICTSFTIQLPIAVSTSNTDIKTRKMEKCFVLWAVF
jgi:hypothetical protein